jgi:predicted Zn-dependent peptidase
MDGKLGPDYYVTDLISDILSNGHSSRMYRRLVMEEKMFGELDAYISGDTGPGLFTVAGKLIEGVSFEKAEKAVWEELEKLKDDCVPEKELRKVINKVEADLVYSEISYLNKAMSLAGFELLGDAGLINRQIGYYNEVTPGRIFDVANKVFRKENCSTLYYERTTNGKK